MRQVSLIALVSVLALFTGGCMAGQEEPQAVKGSPSPQAAVSPRPPKPSPAATPFGSKPLVAQKPGTSSTVAGLIQPDLPENVIKRIPQGQRSDPFTAVPVQPQVTVSPNPVTGGGNGTRPVPVVPPLSPPAGGGGRTPQTQDKGVTAATPVPNLTKLPSPPKGVPNLIKLPSPPKGRPNLIKLPSAPRGKGKASSSSPSKSSSTAKLLPPAKVAPLPLTPPTAVPELPKLPEPTQARGIQVTGVVEVGGVPMAIVKVPNEPSRYVREGQRIANGQVLVKRIEMNQGPEPVVILEQYGIEVARGVGEAPATSPGGPGQTPQGPTASVPYSAPLNTNVPRQA